MLFYKFQSPTTLAFTMLRRGELFFASPGELNDANECRPHLVFNGSTGLWGRLAEFLLERYWIQSDSSQNADHEITKRVFALKTPLGAALKKKVLLKDIALAQLGETVAAVAEPLLTEVLGRDRSRQMVQWIRWFIDQQLPALLEEERYIASFCLSATNPTMWGHYADAERGFAVVYTSDDDSIAVKSPVPILSGSRPSKDHRGITEIGWYKDERLKLVRVKYAARPPKANAFLRLIPQFSYSEEESHYDVPLLLPGDAAQKQESMIGLLKYAEWRYEREIRAFLPVYRKLQPDARAVRVAAENIQGVIFGPNMSHEHMVRVIVCSHLMRAELESTPTRPFMFFHAKRAPDRFRLRVEPVGILHGSYHGGRIPVKRVKDLSAAEAREIRDVADNIDDLSSQRKRNR